MKNQIQLPWTDLSPFNLLDRIEALGKHETVVDWGCGKNESPISEQVRQLECKVLVSIDAWPENIEVVYHQKTYQAVRHEIYRGEVQTLARDFEKGKPSVIQKWKRRFDLSLCLDIVEHMEKEEATVWLNRVGRISDRVLIWIPLGPAIMDSDWWGSNHFYNAHHSQWEREDLEALGYGCEVLENMHTPMFGWRVDGCWAWKGG